MTDRFIFWACAFLFLACLGLGIFSAVLEYYFNSIIFGINACVFFMHAKNLKQYR